MASNGQIVTRDELIDLLNDRSAPVERYRNLLSRKESGQLILPTGFESVIEQLEEKYKDTVDDNDCLVDIQTLKVYDGQDLNHIEPISSGEEEELGSEKRPVSNIELLPSSLESDPSDIEPVSEHEAVQYQQLFLEQDSESEVSEKEKPENQESENQESENQESENQESENVNSDTSEYQRFENQARWSISTSLLNGLFSSPDCWDPEEEPQLTQLQPLQTRNQDTDRHQDNKPHQQDQKGRKIPSNKIPSNKIPSNKIPSNKIPSNRMPSNRMPSNIVANRKSWPPSNLGSAYTAPQYHKAPVSTLVSYEAPSSSKLYDGIFQSRCLQTLKQHLMTKSRLGTEIRSDLESKIMKTIGMNAIPSPGSISMIPFIHFDDSGEYHISILFDCPPFSPWSVYTRNLFGSDFLRLQREVYDLIRTNPTMNVFCTPAALIPSTPIQSIGMASTSDHNTGRQHFGPSFGQKCSPIRSKTKVTSKKQKVTSPNRRTVIEMVQKEYFNVAGDLSTSDLSSTTGSEYAPEQRLYLQSMYSQRPPVRRMLELNGRPKKSTARSVSEKKAQDGKPKGRGRKSLPALPMPNFRDFELGASALSRPSSTSTPSTRTSNGRIASSSRAMSPEIGFSDDAVSSLSAPSTNGSNEAPISAGKKLPVKKIRAQSLLASISASKEKTSKVTPGGSKSNSISTKATPNGSKAPAKRPPEEVSENLASKKRKSDPKAKVSKPIIEGASSSKESTSKTPTSSSSKTTASSSKKVLERVATRVASSITAGHVMSTPITTRPESRSDVPITAGDPMSPNTSTRILRPRKSLLSPKKLVD